MSSGRFIVSESDLSDRNEWLESNSRFVTPYLKNGKECIVYVFTRDASADRLTTRIGGLPYWPTAKRWPSCGTCSEPLAFAAQLDFRHEDVRSSVPGDVLTFHYCFTCRPWRDSRKRDALLTWHQGDRDEPLVDEAVIPASIEDDEPGPAFGIPVHTTDYPTPPEAFGGSIVEGEHYTYLQFTIQGTKIGGYPPPIQDVGASKDNKRQPMQFLATIGSLQVSALPPRKAKHPACGDLIWADMGSIYIWLSRASKHPKTTWFLASY